MIKPAVEVLENGSIQIEFLGWGGFGRLLVGISPDLKSVNWASHVKGRQEHGHSLEGAATAVEILREAK